MRKTVTRFVILKHIAESTHYDLMFERDGALKTFRAADEPSGDEIALEASFDHPPKFLDYEGELRNAPGRVERWDAGAFEAIRWDDEITIRCAGKRWHGTYILKKMDEKRWLAGKQPERQKSPKG